MAGWEEKNKSILDDFCQKCQVLIGSRTLKLNKDISSLGKQSMLAYLEYTRNITWLYFYMIYDLCHMQLQTLSVCAVMKALVSLATHRSTSTHVYIYIYVYKELIQTITSISFGDPGFHDSCHHGVCLHCCTMMSYLQVLMPSPRPTRSRCHGHSVLIVHRRLSNVVIAKAIKQP